MRPIPRIARSAVALAAVVVGLVATTAAPAAAATPPTRPATGTLGGLGPCAQDTRSKGWGNRAQQVWVHYPTGSGTPRTGGTCGDSNRPVVFIAPGYSALYPGVYQGLVDDMVSNGHIVVFVNYSLTFDPNGVYPQVLDGYEVAVDRYSRSRMDLANIGVWGHSYGGGMVPWLAQQVDALGWGGDSLWLVSSATSWVYEVGLDGPIPIPSHARAQVIAYDVDDWVDQRIGIDVFRSYTIPASQKDHIHVPSDVGFPADHTTPRSDSSADTDHLDWYGVYRNYQALSDCARAGTHCGADLTYMGTWSDGHEAPRATVTDTPVDRGLPARAECPGEAGLFESPRTCDI